MLFVDYFFADDFLGLGELDTLFLGLAFSGDARLLRGELFIEALAGEA